MADSSNRGEAGPDHGEEVEWQFDAIDLRPIERWLAALPSRPAGESRPTVTALAKPPRRHVDRYLDTEDWRIGRAGFVLRTRQRGRAEEITLKDNRPADAGGLRTRLEVTEPLPEGGIGGLEAHGPVGRRVRAVAGWRPFLQVLEVRTRRRPFSLRVSGEEVAEVALDETTIVVGDGQRPAQLRRVEVEVAPAWMETLEPVVGDLQVSCGLQPAALSKYEAGLLALGTPVPGPPDLGPTVVDPGSSLGDLALAILRRHLGVLLAHEPGTRLGEDPEELHDMRVATRRLRAAQDLFADVLPARSQTLRRELGWLGTVLGQVRDLDVQLGHMETMSTQGVSWGAAADPADSPLEHLRLLLEAQRDEARAQLLEALDSPRWERLAVGLTSMVQPGAVRRSPAARQPAVVAVPELIEARHRSVVKAARRARRSGVPADFHRLRIRGKRLRYALEFTADLYDGHTEACTRRLARLQDKLGLMQDAEVATARLQALATGGRDALPAATVFAMGAVAERYRVEATGLLEALPAHLKVLHGRKWEELASLMDERRRKVPGAGGPSQASSPSSFEAVTGASPTPPWPDVDVDVDVDVGTADGTADGDPGGAEGTAGGDPGGARTGAPGAEGARQSANGAMVAAGPSGPPGSLDRHPAEGPVRR